MLGYYTATDLLKIIKSLNKPLYIKIKDLSSDNQLYLGNIYLNTQFGGDIEIGNDLETILKVNSEIKNIMGNITDNVDLITKELKFTTDENILLKQQLAELNGNIDNLNIDECNSDTIETYINKFIDTKRLLKRFTGKNLKITALSQETINEYTQLYKNVMAEDESKNCENFKRIKNSFDELNDTNLYYRILDDFESISGTVRVFVRIFNPSILDKTSQFSGSKTFNSTIISDDKNKTKLINKQIIKTCEQESCLSLQSVVANGRMVKRTEFPCDNDEKSLIQFKNNYGPFFSVFENNTNKEVYSGTNDNIGVNTIIKQVKKSVNTTIFSYGLSGAGKSFSVFGSSTEQGIVELLLNDLEKDTSSISMNVYELYGKLQIIGNRVTQKYSIDKKIIDYGTTEINNVIDINNKIKEINIQRRQENRIKFTTNNPDSSRGHLFIKLNITLKTGKKSSIIFIDSAGVEDPFIIARSFLHIDKFSIKYLNNDIVKVLITDSTNNSLLIKTTYWSNKIIDSFLKQNNWANELKQYINGNKIIVRDVPIQLKPTINKAMRHLFLHSLRLEIIKNDDTFIKLFGSLNYNNVNIINVVNYLWDMFTEGLYINETLNHFRVYMQSRIGRKITFNERFGYYNYHIISASEYYTGGENGYTPSKFLQNPLEEIKNKNKINLQDLNSGNIDMINFLRYLNDSDDKKTKYILLMNIRTDLDTTICNGTNNTLKFANSVKST
jgi:hypothetical protein